jgi:hypothetical protein
VNGFLGTGFNAVRPFFVIFAEIAFDDLGMSPVRLDISEGATHHAHKTASASFFIILNLTCAGIFLERAGHTGDNTFRFRAVPAEKGKIAPGFALYNSMPGFVFGVPQVEVVYRAGPFPMSLHTGDATVLATFAFILVDKDSFHPSSLNVQSGAFFQDDLVKQIRGFFCVIVEDHLSAGEGNHILTQNLDRDLTACDKGGQSQVERQSQGKAETAIRKGLFFEPLGGGKRQGKLRYIDFESFGEFGGHDFQPAYSKAGAEIQYRRDAQFLANPLEFWSR